MKIIPLLTALAASPVATYASYFVRSAPFAVSEANGRPAAKDTALKLRGGDLGPISSKALATTFGVLAIGDAAASGIAPIEVWEKFGVIIEPGSKGEHFLGHGMASSASSLAVTSLLALTDATTVEEALGYGFLARAAFMTNMLANKKYEDLGVPTAPHVAIFAILLFTAYALLSGNSEYNALAKVVSIVLAGHGGLLFLNPRVGGKYDTNYCLFVQIKILLHWDCTSYARCVHNMHTKTTARARR